MDNKSDFDNGQASKPYKITGIHLLMIIWRIFIGTVAEKWKPKIFFVTVTLLW